MRIMSPNEQNFEIRYRRLFETARDGIIILNAQTGQIDDANPFLLKMLGYSRQEMADMKFWDIFPLKEVPMARFKELQVKKYLRFEDLPLESKEGKRTQVEFVNNIYEVNGKKVAQCNIRDIAERKKTEEKLEQYNESLELQVSQRTNQLIGKNEELKHEIIDRQASERHVYASNKILKLLAKRISQNEYSDSLVRLLMDWSRCRCVGVQVINGKEQFHYDSFQGFKPEFWKLENGLSLLEKEIFSVNVLNARTEAEYLTAITVKGAFRCDNTKEFVAGISKKAKINFLKARVKNGFMSVAIIPIYSQGKIIAAIHLADERPCMVNLSKIEFIEQLTPLIAEGIDKFDIENKMNIAHEELAQSKRLSDIGTLAATVAHELRNPLAAINIAMQNIRRKKQDLPIDTHLDSIEKKVKESDQIISNLLFCSRLKTPHYEAVNIRSILVECVEIIKKRDNKRKFKLIQKIEETKVLIDADPLQMRELFSNILNNAFDAIAAKNGVITVGLEINDVASVVIYFKDNGIGISVEDLKKIQEPFFTTKAKGTGLGLTVCQQIIMQHNGEFDIKSEVGQGTIVTICLPKKR